MPVWFSENLGTIVIAALVAAAVAVAVWSLVRRRKRGGGCGCGCYRKISVFSGS